MTLASLANAPTDGNSMSEWTFAHSDLCLRTIDFLNGKDNKLIMQQMDPIATYDVQSALLRIQDVHNGINGVLHMIPSQSGPAAAAQFPLGPKP